MYMVLYYAQKCAEGVVSIHQSQAQLVTQKFESFLILIIVRPYTTLNPSYALSAKD